MKCDRLNFGHQTGQRLLSPTPLTDAATLTPGGQTLNTKNGQETRAAAAAAVVELVKLHFINPCREICPLETNSKRSTA